MTYIWNCDSQVHHDIWFGAGTQGVAPDQINGRRRRHVEFPFCCFRHQEKWDLHCTRQPGQVTYLRQKSCVNLCGVDHLLPITKLWLQLKHNIPQLLVSLAQSGLTWWLSEWMNLFGVSCVHSMQLLSTVPPSIIDDRSLSVCVVSGYIRQQG